MAEIHHFVVCQPPINFKKKKKKRELEAAINLDLLVFIEKYACEETNFVSYLADILRNKFE